MMETYGNVWGMENPSTSVDNFRDTKLGVYKEVNQATNAFGNDLHYGLSSDMRPNYSASTDQRMVGLQSGIKTDASSSADYTNGGAFRATNSAFTHFGSGQVNGASALSLNVATEGTGGITRGRAIASNVQTRSASTITTAQGNYSEVRAFGGGTIVNGSNFEAIANTSAGGTIENWRGVVINPNSAANITNTCLRSFYRYGFQQPTQLQTNLPFMQIPMHPHS